MKIDKKRSHFRRTGVGEFLFAGHDIATRNDNVSYPGQSFNSRRLKPEEVRTIEKYTEILT